MHRSLPPRRVRAHLIRTVAVLAVAALQAAACAPDEPEAPALAAEGTLAVEGAQLRYWTAGSGAPVILLHDGPGYGVGYLLAGLEIPGFPPEGFMWVAYDQRGSGRSTGAERPELLTMDRFVEDLEAVRQATGRERVALMGHGFGGLLALHYALRYPEHVGAMILIDPEPASRALWERHRAIVESRRTDEARRVMEAVEADGYWRLDPRQVEIHTLAALEAFFGRPEAARNLRLGIPQSVYGNFPGTAERVRASLGDWDLFEALQGLPVRTLIVTGDAGPFPLEAHQRLHEALPRSELVVLEGVGHYPHMEDSEGFARAVKDFLDRITAPSAGG